MEIYALFNGLPGMIALRLGVMYCGKSSSELLDAPSAEVVDVDVLEVISGALVLVVLVGVAFVVPSLLCDGLVSVGVSVTLRSSLAMVDVVVVVVVGVEV